jgi:hypothetical protein
VPVTVASENTVNRKKTGAASGPSKKLTKCDYGESFVNISSFMIFRFINQSFFALSLAPTHGLKEEAATTGPVMHLCLTSFAT